MKMKHFLIVMMIVLACPFAAHAQTDRTNWAWDTKTPDQGKLLARLWVTYETSEYAAYDVDRESTVTEAQLHYGIKDNWSVGLSGGYLTDKMEGYGRKVTEDDFSDLTVHTTYRFLDEDKAGVDLALRGSVNVPVADEDHFGSGNWEPKLQVFASKTFGSVIGVANLGVKHIIDSDRGERDFVYDAILEGIVPLSDRLSVSGIFSTGSMRWESNENDAYYAIGAGMRFATSKTSALGVAVNRYVANDTYNNDWRIAVHMSVEF